jgi:hypothetical protein
MEKIVVCKSDKAQREIQPLLDEGWQVKSICAEHVSVSTTGQYNTTKCVEGDIVFILEK